MHVPANVEHQTAITVIMSTLTVVVTLVILLVAPLTATHGPPSSAGDGAFHAWWKLRICVLGRIFGPRTSAT